MDKYEIGNQTFALIDNQLWQLIKPISDYEASEEPIKKDSKQSAWAKLTPQQIQKMVADRLGGMKLSKVSEKYNVSAPTVAYWIKKHSNTSDTLKPNKINDYTCRDCRWAFKSNLHLIDTKCPRCNSLEIQKGSVEKEIVES